MAFEQLFVNVGRQPDRAAGAVGNQAGDSSDSGEAGRGRIPARANPLVISNKPTISSLYIVSVPIQISVSFVLLYYLSYRQQIKRKRWSRQ